MYYDDMTGYYVVDSCNFDVSAGGYVMDYSVLGNEPTLLTQYDDELYLYDHYMTYNHVGLVLRSANSNIIEINGGVMRKYLVVIVCFIMFILCGCASNNRTTDVDVDSVNNEVIDTVERYINGAYREIVMRNIDNLIMAGSVITCNVYLLDSEYVFVTIDDKEATLGYIRMLYSIDKDLPMRERCVLVDNRIDSTSTDNLELISSIEVSVPYKSEVIFNDYQGKTDSLSNLEEMIKYRYFDFSEDKPLSDYPVFHNETKAVKVDLVDFDDCSFLFHLFVHTEDSNVYEVSMHEYSDDGWVFIENTLSCYSEESKSESNETKDNNLQDFIAYKEFADKHIIKSITRD